MPSGLLKSNVIFFLSSIITTHRPTAFLVSTMHHLLVPHHPPDWDLIAAPELHTKYDALMRLVNEILADRPNQRAENRFLYVCCYQCTSGKYREHRMLNRAVRLNKELVEGAEALPEDRARDFLVHLRDGLTNLENAVGYQKASSNKFFVRLMNALCFRQQLEYDDDDSDDENDVENDA